MKIKSIKAIPVFFKLFKPFIFSGVKLEILDYVLVRIETNDGAVGFGECPVYWEPRGETQISTLEDIEKVKPYLLGLRADDVEARLEIFQKYIPRAYAAQCGLDLAMYDATGKTLNLPVYKFFGEAKPIPVDVVIPMMGKNEAEPIINKSLSEQVKVFKVKVGQDIENEVELLKMIRGKIGSELLIYVDANQGFKSVDDTVSFIKRIVDLDIAWIEQPLPASAPLEEFIQLKKQLPIKIMLDESVYTFEDVELFAGNEACDMFNIKLAKSGGISGAIKFFEVAEKFGKECMLGSMIEGASGTFGGAHFASTHQMIITALTAYRFIDDELAFGPKIKSSLMEVPEKPGLGCEKEELFQKRFDDFSDII